MEFDHSITEFMIANCAILLGSVVQTTTGMGFAMVSVPLLALISLDFVPGPTIFVNLFLTLLMLNDGRSTIVKREITILLPSLLIGTLLGVAVLSLVPAHTLGILFALLVLLAIAVTFLVEIHCLTPVGLFFGGVASGLMGTTSGIHGPPLAVLYQHENTSKVRATMALVFLVAYSLSLIALGIFGDFNSRQALSGSALLPGLLIGFQIGKRVRHQIPPLLARTIMLSIASISSVILLVKSVS